MRNLVVLGIASCGDNVVVLDPAGELVKAIDTNPDPDIVEIELIATAAMVDYVGVATPVVAYRDGASTRPARVPGPLIEATRGNRLIVHFRNDTTLDTTIHWHGLRLPIEMDGDPAVGGAIPPGGSFDYDFTLRDGGLYWYHPHVETDEQIELGLQAPLIVRVPPPIADAEPVFAVERVLVLDDIDVLPDGNVRIVPTHDDLVLGRRGSTVLVNGKPPGFVTASAGSVERWRIVNTSNGRFFELELDGLPMRVIGWDGGLIARPYDVDRLLVAPGERYDLVVALDRPRGDRLELVSRDVSRGHGAVDRGGLILRLDLDGEPIARDAIPDAGPSQLEVPVTQESIQRRFEITESLEGPAGVVYFINGQRWPLNTPIDRSLGATELWSVVNDTDGDHPFHIHGTFVEVRTSAGVAQPRQLGRKDTFVVPPRSTVELGVRFDDLGKWMFHCQIPEHAERGMTADINVQP